MLKTLRPRPAEWVYITLVLVLIFTPYPLGKGVTFLIGWYITWPAGILAHPFVILGFLSILLRPFLDGEPPSWIRDPVFAIVYAGAAYLNALLFRQLKSALCPPLRRMIHPSRPAA